MKNNLTDITIILDRSGSMSGIRQDTIGGINTFINGQKEAEGECVLSLIQFDNEYKVNYTAKPIAEVEELNGTTYVPRGSTALNDAIGRTINSVGDRLASKLEQDRPEKVVIVIVTDGYENASMEFTKADVKQMIEHQENKYNWEFIFLGANMDAVSEGASYGTKFDKTMTWSTDSIGINNTYMSLSEKVVNYRGGQNLAFDANDRAKAVGK